jgi:hypothetical protein
VVGECLVSPVAVTVFKVLVAVVRLVLGRVLMLLMFFIIALKVHRRIGVKERPSPKKCEPLGIAGSV